MANTEETVVGIPVIAQPIEVQVALGIVPVEICTVAVVIRILPDRTIARNIVYDTIL